MQPQADRGAVQDPRGTASLGGVEGILLGLGSPREGGSQLEPPSFPAQTTTGHLNPRASCPTAQGEV